MLLFVLALACAEVGDCDAGAPSFYIEPVTESGAFIEEIEIESSPAELDPPVTTACVLGEEYWECGSGQPGAYKVFLGGPGWNRTVETVEVAAPEDACFPEREVTRVKMLPED
ncbi:MAG: hypothetical protein VX899_23665 [Myxococcota bacterium]|nr:hypothetical protein [Myxococcota bacterium]